MEGMEEVKKGVDRYLEMEMDVEGEKLLKCH